MSSAKLRKVGGSVMVGIPPAALRRLKLGPGATVEVEVEGDRIAIKPTTAPRYALGDLLAEHAATTSSADAGEDLAWVRSKPTGRELI